MESNIRPPPTALSAWPGGARNWRWGHLGRVEGCLGHQGDLAWEGGVSGSCHGTWDRLEGSQADKVPGDPHQLLRTNLAGWGEGEALLMGTTVCVSW